MAKQTFTTGQVLTAAQMTSLQQTAMGGGSATAKTASYVLVAADAGTTVAMNAAGSTTITVNTGLFAAGDTVFIQNLGAGACTVTAGTATVATAGSLILPQNDAGILYFTATGTAIFYDYIQAGAVSPLTTKGDVYTFSTSDARLGVGANNTILTADSAEATGLKWATPASGGNDFTLLNSGGTALTGAATVTISSISGKNTIMIHVEKASSSSSSKIFVRLNTDTTATNYKKYGSGFDNTTTYAAGNTYAVNGSVTGEAWIDMGELGAANQMSGAIMIYGANTTNPKMFQGVAGVDGSNNKRYIVSGAYLGTSTISSISVTAETGNLDAGTVFVYASAV